MPPRSGIVRVGLVATAALLVVACKKAAPPAPAIHELVVHTADYAFTAPDTVPAGLTRIVSINSGPSLHHVTMVRLDSGYTLDSLLGALAHPGPLPSWAHFEGGPNFPIPGDTGAATMLLEAGNYAMICVIPDSLGAPHFTHGMAHALVVTPNPAPVAAEPDADLEVRLSDYAFTLSSDVTAGDHTIRVLNDGPQEHEMVVVQLDSGKTVQDVSTWVTTGMKGPPPGRPIGGIAPMSPGGRNVVTLHFAPGDYGFLCFVPDAHDGKAHSDHGMMKQIHVS